VKKVMVNGEARDIVVFPARNEAPRALDPPTLLQEASAGLLRKQLSAIALAPVRVTLDDALPE